MKMKNFFVLLLTIIMSLFMVACGRGSTKESSEMTNKNELFSVVELNTVQGVCEYYLDALDVTTRIKPLNINGKYSDNEVRKEGNIYIDVTLGVKNLSNESKIAEDIITTKIKINDNEYTCFSLVESGDGYELEEATSINSMEKREVHYVAEVPKTEATGKIEVILTIDGKDYSNNFDLESITIKSPTVEDIEKSQIDNVDKKTDTQGNSEQNIKNKESEADYYLIIKEAWQRQVDYINSIEDPTVKQSVQTSHSAAIMESNRLLIEHPEDAKDIEESLNKVLNGE